MYIRPMLAPRRACNWIYQRDDVCVCHTEALTCAAYSAGQLWASLGDPGGLAARLGAAAGPAPALQALPEAPVAEGGIRSGVGGGDGGSGSGPSLTSRRRGLRAAVAPSPPPPPTSNPLLNSLTTALSSLAAATTCNVPGCAVDGCAAGPWYYGGVTQYCLTCTSGFAPAENGACQPQNGRWVAPRVLARMHPHSKYYAQAIDARAPECGPE